MSSRPQIKKFPVITNGDMSQPSITSAVTIIQELTQIGYSYSWSGTSPVGTVQIQVSNDYAVDSSGAASSAGTWNTITVEYNGSAVTTVPVSGNTGSGFINIAGIAAYAIRTVYTGASGTGTLQSIVTAKVA
jgi:hypothetical protein